MSIGRPFGVHNRGPASQFGKRLPSADSDTHIWEVQLELGFFSDVPGRAAPRYSKARSMRSNTFCQPILIPAQLEEGFDCLVCR